MFTKKISSFYALNLVFNNTKVKYIYFTKIFLYGLLIYLYSTLFLSPIKEYFIYNIPELSTYSIEQDRKTFNYFLIFQTIFLAPILEELTFRNLLTNNQNIIILCLVLICLFNPFLLPIVIIVFYILKQINTKGVSHKSIFIVSILFAIAHVFNTPNILTNNPVLVQTILSIPLFLIPYFILGYHLGVIKVNLGIKWAIAGHIFYNLIFVVTSYFFTP